MAYELSYLGSGAEPIVIDHEGVTFAMVIPANYTQPNVTFFTPPQFSQQLGFINYPTGHLIEPHVHNPVAREVSYTNEVLFLRKGRVRVDFYDEQQQYLESINLGAGDVILLIRGGHGFEILEECEMIEVKQGPYSADDDKTRFRAAPKQIVFNRK